MPLKKKTRKIVHIDEDKCDGCGLCVPSCAEGAIRIVDGKARLVADKFCDGLGACLGECPNDAIRIEERPADDFDEEAVKTHLKERERQEKKAKKQGPEQKTPCGCPGAMMRMLQGGPKAEAGAPGSGSGAESRLRHWPVQLMLLPEKGPVWEGADVLLAADCAAFAMADFHEKLLKGRSLAVGCPKLDDAQHYVDKFSRVLANNDVRSVTVARMEVPCCGGLEEITRLALARSGKDIPVHTAVVSTRGSILRWT